MQGFQLHPSPSDSLLFQRVELSGRLTRPTWSMFDKDPFVTTFGDSIYSRRVILGLAQVIQVDSLGAQWLLESTDNFASRGGRLRIHSVPNNTRCLLALMGLDASLAISADAASAETALHEGR